jgi:hypothetical protein
MSDQTAKNNTILLLAGVLFIIWGILGMMDSKNYAYSGYGTDGDNTIIQVREGSPAEAAGMQVGDVMKSFDGIAVTDAKAFSERERTEIGQTVAIVVDRNGEEQTLNVTYSGLPDKNKSLNMAAFVMGLLFVLLGLYVHNKKKTALTGLFAAFAICFGYIWFNGPNIGPGFLSNLVNSIGTTIVMFSFVALARFSLKYAPESSFMNGGNNRLIYVPAVIIVLIIWVLNFVQPDSTSTLNVTIRLLFGVIIIFYFALAIISLLGKYMKANAEQRKSLGLNMMFLGVLIGILPFLIYYTINTFSPATILPGNDYMFLTFAAMPIFFSMGLLQNKEG